MLVALTVSPMADLSLGEMFVQFKIGRALERLVAHLEGLLVNDFFQSDALLVQLGDPFNCFENLAKRFDAKAVEAGHAVEDVFGKSCL